MKFSAESETGSEKIETYGFSMVNVNILIYYPKQRKKLFISSHNHVNGMVK